MCVDCGCFSESWQSRLKDMKMGLDMVGCVRDDEIRVSRVLPERDERLWGGGDWGEQCEWLAFGGRYLFTRE